MIISRSFFAGLFLALYFVVFTHDLNAQVIDGDISIDDVIFHLESGETDILDNHQVNLRNIKFKTGASELDAGEKAYLDSLADYLVLIPTVPLYVNGYTDNVGQFNENIRLSKKRANVVRDYLVNRGVAASQVTAEGFGQANAKASNRTAAGREINRRVELHFKNTETRGEKSSVPVSSEPSNSMITLNNGTQVPAAFFMKSHDSDEVLYKEKPSDKALKRLRVSEIKSISLPNGIPFDMAKLASSRVLKLNPTPTLSYALNNGQELKAEVSKVFANGDSLAYKVKRTDKTEQKIATADIAKIRVIEKEIPKPEANPTDTKANDAPEKQQPAPSSGKEVSIQQLFNSNEFEKPRITAQERLKSGLSTAHSILSKTSPFVFLGRVPVSTKATRGNLLVLNGNDTTLNQAVALNKNNGGFGIGLGFENEFGRDRPSFYVRAGWTFGLNTNTGFRMLYGGIGKILGKSGSTRFGVDVGTSRCRNTFEAIRLGGPLLVDDYTFTGSINMRFQTVSLTLLPNASYEYVSDYGSNRTVRISLGFPISVPLRSEVQVVGSSYTAEFPLRKGKADLIINKQNVQSYTMSKLFGVQVTIGYVFLK